MVFKIPQSWAVFVLEDSADRIAWFRRRIPYAAIATSCDKALRVLSECEFKIVFLDHDLGFLDAAYPDRLHGNGKEVARYLARTAFPGVVVIHSKHDAGANAMKVHLPKACLTPFGTFEIEMSEVFALDFN
jgi:NAD+-processing family protein with receiver domain